MCRAMFCVLGVGTRGRCHASVSRAACAASAPDEEPQIHWQNACARLWAKVAGVEFPHKSCDAVRLGRCQRAPEAFGPPAIAAYHERGKFQNYLLVGDGDNAEDDWSLFKAKFYRARGKIVGAAIISLPGDVAVFLLQLHSLEHRAWSHGTLPGVRNRMAAFKILDMSALGSFASSGADLDCGSPLLHPVSASAAQSGKQVFDMMHETTHDSIVFS